MQAQDVLGYVPRSDTTSVQRGKVTDQYCMERRKAANTSNPTPPTSGIDGGTLDNTRCAEKAEVKMRK